MEWLKTLAPLLGTALGGPLGGAAAAMIADKLGLESKTVEAVTDALASGKMSPEQVGAVKLAELDFKRFLEQNKIDLAKLDVQNTQGARDMHIALKSHTPDVLSFIIVAGFFGVLALMLSGRVTFADQQALLILLGSLSAGFGAVLNFWLGSSASSKAKDILIANAPPVK